MTTMTDLPDLNKLPDHSPRHKLITLLEFMKNRGKLSEYGQDSSINFFMRWIGLLYLDYYQFHLNEAKEIGEKYEEVLLSLLEPIYKVHIWEFIHHVHQIDFAYADFPWEEACWTKTNLEAFHEMFGSITGFIEGCSVDELNEEMQIESHQYLGTKDPPPNVPKHHWWWFMYFGERWDEEGFEAKPEDYP